MAKQVTLNTEPFDDSAKTYQIGIAFADIAGTLSQRARLRLDGVAVLSDGTTQPRSLRGPLLSVPGTTQEHADALFAALAPYIAAYRSAVSGD